MWPSKVFKVIQGCKGHGRSKYFKKFKGDRSEYVFDIYHYSETSLNFKTHLPHMLRKSAYGTKMSLLKDTHLSSMSRFGGKWVLKLKVVSE